MEALGIDPKFILVQAIGFALLAFVLAKYAFSPVMNMLEQRQNTIRGNLDEAEARRNEMVRLQQEYEDRLAKIEEEARDKIQVAVKEAQAARDEIISRARAESEAIIQRGQQDIQREREQAAVEMRNQVADLATLLASRVVKQQINAANHAQLIDDVIAGIGATNGSVSGATGAGGMR